MLSCFAREHEEVDPFGSRLQLPESAFQRDRHNAREIGTISTGERRHRCGATAAGTVSILSLAEPNGCLRKDASARKPLLRLRRRAQTGAKQLPSDCQIAHWSPENLSIQASQNRPAFGLGALFAHSSAPAAPRVSRQAAPKAPALPGEVSAGDGGSLTGAGEGSAQRTASLSRRSGGSWCGHGRCGPISESSGHPALHSGGFHPWTMDET